MDLQNCPGFIFAANIGICGTEGAPGSHTWTQGLGIDRYLCVGLNRQCAGIIVPVDGVWFQSHLQLRLTWAATVVIFSHIKCARQLMWRDRSHRPVRGGCRTAALLCPVATQQSEIYHIILYHIKILYYIIIYYISYYIILSYYIISYYIVYIYYIYILLTCKYVLFILYYIDIYIYGLCKYIYILYYSLYIYILCIYVNVIFIQASVSKVILLPSIQVQSPLSLLPRSNSPRKAGAFFNHARQPMSNGRDI